MTKMVKIPVGLNGRCSHLHNDANSINGRRIRDDGVGDDTPSLISPNF
jgi:hypothetical protein